MKLSAYHKQQGDEVEWYNPLTSGHMDKVYMSKVFSFTKDYEYFVDADEIFRGGTGYCIETINGKEIYHCDKDNNLPSEVEHICPDYSLYQECNDTAYGFLTRGCPRGCDFCHVQAKEGSISTKVADLSEFWNGQKNIVLCDPNLIACKNWKQLLQQLIDSKSYIDINQGVDIRIMTDEKAEMIRQCRIKSIHFAWDRIEDEKHIVPKFEMFQQITGWKSWKMIVYVLTNFNTTIEEDLYRIYKLRELGYDPYVMIYDKEHTNSKDTVRRLQRWCNNRRIFKTVSNFNDYIP